MTKPDKDGWDKADIAAKYVGPFLIAVGALVLGLFQAHIQFKTARSQAELQAATARSQAELQAATAHTQMAISILGSIPINFS